MKFVSSTTAMHPAGLAAGAGRRARGRGLVAPLLALAVAVAAVSTALHGARAGEPVQLLPPDVDGHRARDDASAPWADLVEKSPPEAHAEDGYPNIGYDPAAGITPLKNTDEQASEMDRLRALSAANRRRGAAAAGPSFEGRLRHLKDTHGADALKEIEGGS